jgi:hypothetical protein
MFMAKRRTCDECFFVFENALSSNSIPYDVIQHPLNIIKRHRLGHVQSTYTTTFLPTDHDYRLRIQMTKLTQNNDLIDAYNRNLFAISTQLTGLTVADRLIFYTSGLHGRIRYDVLSKQPKSLDDALAVAT